MGAYPKLIFKHGPGTESKEAHSLEEENKFRAAWGKPPKHPHGVSEKPVPSPVKELAPVVEVLESLVVEAKAEKSPEVVIKKSRSGKK